MCPIACLNFAQLGGTKKMDTLVLNHCALCGVEVEPEDEVPLPMPQGSQEYGALSLLWANHLHL